MKKTARKWILFLLVLATVFSLKTVNASITCSRQSASEFANFRNVRAGSIGTNNLFRSQHPANGSARSYYANRLAEEKEIRIILNLSDSESSLRSKFLKKGIDSSYYYRKLFNQGHVYTANMSVEHNGAVYRKKVAGGLRFLARYTGPYLVHCEVGRDRTGFVMLLLESLMGAPYNYMLEDYAKSYMNVSGWSHEKAREKAIGRLSREFEYMTGKSRKTDWRKLNLVKYAEKYLKKGGMTAGEIAALKRNLSVSYSKCMLEYVPAKRNTRKEEALKVGTTRLPGK